MKIAVVEDEKLAQDRIKRLLDQLGYSFDLYGCAKDLLEKGESLSYDLYLLDINMPQMSGMELAYELRLIDPKGAIIFQTAYEEHALQAFKVGAIDYLLKPYTVEQLEQSIDRLKALQTPEQEIQLLSKNGDEFYVVKPSEIYYIQADLTEVMIRTKEGFSYFNKKISQMEELLTPYNFFRIHRSILVNVDQIKQMRSVEQSRLEIGFEGIKDVVESSKDGAKRFREMVER
jgi:two-component system LytT family response regulator